MATDIPMPSYSDNMEEADLIGWLVAPGDFVQEGDPIAEIETDKATGELESPVSGTLVEICVAEGTTGVKVGAVVARIDAAEAPTESPSPPEATPPSSPEPVPDALPTEEAAPPAETPIEASTAPRAPEMPVAPETPTPAQPPTAPVTALAKRVAEQSGLDLSGLRGTGAHGRITKADVEAAAMNGGSGTTQPLSVLDIDCNVSAALEVCRQTTGREGDLQITLVVFAVRAAVLALREVPDLAARIQNAEGGFAVRVHAATDPPRVLREAERKSLAVLAGELREDLEPTSETPAVEIFDFTDLGIDRVQAAATGAPVALGIGAPRLDPGGEGPGRANFTLSVDTSRIDLAAAALWFAAFGRRIEDPLEMLL